MGIIPPPRDSLFRFIPKPKDAVIIANTLTGAVGIGVLTFMILFFTILFGIYLHAIGDEIQGIVVLTLGGLLAALILAVWTRFRRKSKYPGRLA
jgi:hypothetical protein